jgi:rare lipoprotein A
MKQALGDQLSVKGKIENPPVGSIAFMKPVCLNSRVINLFLVLALLALAGCGGKKPVRARTQPPPPEVASRVPATEPSKDEAVNEPDLGGETDDAYKNAVPIYVETGLASWYGPPYHNRKAASGEVFNTHALTAAHKTLPLQSIVRVTNPASGKSVIVRINDRGPFVGDRIIDLSMAAAKAIDVWRAGVAPVKLEVLSAPSSLDKGGRWCVQIGAFSDEEDALRLKSRLMRKYTTAKVIQFNGPTGSWVRLRPANDDRGRAFEVARDTKVEEGGVFLVRLD